MKSKSKNDIFYLILLILTMITMVIGITFTYFGLIAKEDDDSTRIQTGTLSINYIDGMTIDTYALLPSDEPSINSNQSVYKKKFSVKSNGTLDQTLDLYIKVKENGFTNGALKYSIYDSSNTKLGTGNLPIEKDAKLLMASDVYLKSNNTEEFTVLIWLQENNKNQDHEAGKTFVGGFEITATQIKYK